MDESIPDVRLDPVLERVVVIRETCAKEDKHTQLAFSTTWLVLKWNVTPVRCRNVSVPVNY